MLSRHDFELQTHIYCLQVEVLVQLMKMKTLDFLIFYEVFHNSRDDFLRLRIHSMHNTSHFTPVTPSEESSPRTTMRWTQCHVVKRFVRNSQNDSMAVSFIHILYIHCQIKR